MRPGQSAARRAVVLDPDPMSARVLGFVLREASYDVVVAATPSALLGEVTRRETHAIVLEAELGGTGGYQLCREIRGRGYTGPLVFVSRATDAPSRIRCLESGADDVVSKPYDTGELVARVESVARRCRRADHQAMGTLLTVGDAELHVTNLTFTIDGRRRVYLSPTEMRLLECLVRNHGITVTRDTLIDRAWPNDFIADTNRVDVYVGRLRRKIERDPANPEYIHTVRGIGYVFRAQVRGQVVELAGRWEGDTAVVASSEART
jgi:two-component system, OmpR family, response regulator RegX3